MDCTQNYILLVSITELTVIMHAFGKTLEGIGRSTAMSLILLKNYQNRVATFRGKADEEHASEFIDKWGSVVGNHDLTIDVLNQVEKDWMYTLHLTSRSGDVIMDLIVNLHAKILAMHQVIPYLTSIIYYTFIPNWIRLEECRHVALHLLIFSHLGTDELITSTVRVFDALLTTDLQSILMDLRNLLKITQPPTAAKNILFPSYDQIEIPANTETEEIEMAIQNGLTPCSISEYAEHCWQEHLLMKLMLGALEESVRNEGIVGPIWKLNELKLLWGKTEDISKCLTNCDSKSTNEDQCTLADIIRANLIGIAEINNVCRKNITEKFESMIPNNLQISISNNMVTNNANLEDKYY